MYCKKCRYNYKGNCNLEIANICPANSFSNIEITNDELFELILEVINIIKEGLK